MPFKGRDEGYCGYNADADIMLMQVSEKAKSKGIKIKVKDAFKEKAMKVGYDPLYGARPLRRAITRLLEDCLA